MKIETNRNNQNNKKDSSVKKSDNSPSKFLDQKEIFDSKAPTTGAFEKILAETRKQNGKPDDFSANLKQSSDSDIKADETDERLELALSGKDEVEEETKHERGGDDQTSGGDENHQTAPALAMNSEMKASTENPFAAARSILHVADLERIVATIRSETFRNSKQVEIALKHSVLEGLKIKLTIDKNGKMKAEFLAQNEQVKKQLNARKKELNEIFVQRAVNFSEIEIVDKNEESAEKEQFA